MNRQIESLYVALAFIGIVMITSLILYLCVRLLKAEERNQMLVSESFNPVMSHNIDVEVINEILVMYPSQRLKIITNNFKEKLGKGGYGVVYRGTLECGEPVAVKVLNCCLSDKEIKRQFKAEVNSIRRTRHPNLVKLYGFCFDEGLKALVYEFMENGSLSSLLFDEKKKKKGIGFEQLRNIAIGTAQGMAYLHEDCQEKIIHYDIKPENILLDRDLSPKVSDFGLAKLCRKDVTHWPTSGFKGTPGYAAPEMWLPFPITHKCDVYSFGMLLFEILGRRRNLDPAASNSQEWLPKYVWKMYEEGTTGEMMVAMGIDEKDRESAMKMAMVALWCVQQQPELRPLMSRVVKMLEGGVKIDKPMNPFLQVHQPSYCFNDLGDVSCNAASASSGSSVWITPLSREDYLTLR